MILYAAIAYAMIYMESTLTAAPVLNGPLFKETPSGGFLGAGEKSMCVECKGAKMLCAKTRCPLLVKYYEIGRAHV
jgi:hypothetical protein